MSMRFRFFIIFLSALFASAFACVRCVRVHNTDVFNCVNVEKMGSEKMGSKASMLLRDVLADGPVFLIVWANFCAPCVAKIPSIPRLQAALRSKGLKTRVVMVSVDPKKEKAAYGDTNCSLSQVLQLWSQELSSVMGKVVLDSIPCALLLDKKGQCIRVIKALVPEKVEWDCKDVVSQIECFEQCGADIIRKKS